MKLSDYFADEYIIRDCSFDALGLSNSKINKRLLSYLDDRKFLEEILSNENICCVICRSEDVNLFAGYNIAIVVSSNPRKEYFLLHNKLATNNEYFHELSNTKIGINSKISKLASISYQGVTIGNNVTIDDFVKIVGPCTIGDNTVIHSGCIIGGDGFEFKRYQSDILDVIHCGSVVIGENSIIWENTTIHKAVYPWDRTYIGDWVRIGAHTHIDHGAKIEKFVEICARCTISGRVHIGEYSFIGPGSIVSNRIMIGEKSKVLLGSVVTKDIESNQTVSGNFAIPHDKHMNSVIKEANAVLR